MFFIGSSYWNDQWVYLLFEHKSTPDKKIHKKLFRYIIEIWALHEKQQDETFNRLPVVIPIIVYNGNTPVISPIV
jgi:predicted transposase YdaD